MSYSMHKFQDVPASLEWLPPWEPVSTGDVEYARELERELSDQHPLFGIPAVAIAKRNDCDDVLFLTADPTKPLAAVHLTWRARSESSSTWPFTKTYESWFDWIERRMKPDHKEYSSDLTQGRES